MELRWMTCIQCGGSIGIATDVDMNMFIACQKCGISTSLYNFRRIGPVQAPGVIARGPIEARGPL
jgi:predicted  nucleic acid-binding Zn-ribbon protein